jgi:two-component system NtrC family sensor kinase
MKTSAAGKIPPLPTKETILVVDDHPELCQIASILLGRCGYRVLTANCGQEALEIAVQNPQIALLLTDVEMPGMPGDELAELFRVTRPNTAVVFMSGNPMQQHRLKGRPFIEKPFIRLDILVSTVHEALQRRCQATPAAVAAA